MADIYKADALDTSLLDPNTTVSHWRSLEGREKSMQEINKERLKTWRSKYDASISMDNWRRYHQQSQQPERR